ANDSKVVEKQYGLNDYFNVVNEIVGEKYAKVMDMAWGQTDLGRDSKFQSILLIEILKELRKLNKLMVIQPPLQTNSKDAVLPQKG
ncbi:hypothetical protein KKF61_07220, partial [Patescibacteria group bacterium]|nr:hypothetical protein [Patescibacteria group bacterium]